jgi:hypothetical protein
MLSHVSSSETGPDHIPTLAGSVHRSSCRYRISSQEASCPACFVSKIIRRLVLRGRAARI